MNDVMCELCPISSECNAYREAEEDNDSGYHHQNVVRVWSEECPLVSLIKKPKEAK